MNKILENILYGVLIAAFLISGIVILVKSLPTCWFWYLVLILSSSIMFFIEIKNSPEEDEDIDQ